MLLLLAFVGVTFQTFRSAAGTVTLAWDAVNDPTVIAYNLYYGSSPLNYSSFVSAGPSNSVVVPNLTAGATYYFAVTAINIFGLESVFSPPVIYRLPSTCTIVMGDLLQTYDGTPKPVSVSTVPPGLEVAVTYDGQTNPPTGLGSYQVVAKVLDPIYGGSASGTLIIALNEATILLDNLHWVYDGNRKEPTVTTTPPGLPVTLTYNGLADPPTNAGTYAISAEIFDPQFIYAGLTNGVFTVAKANASVLLSGLAWVYDGTRKSALATTTPPGLAVSLTYDGQTQAPYAAGSYTVIASITDPNYQGSATQTLTITGGKSGSGTTAPALPYPANPSNQATSQVSPLGEPLQIRWQTGHSGLVSIFESPDLEHWTLLTNLGAPSSTLMVRPETSKGFYKAVIVNHGATNQLPLNVGKLNLPDRPPQPAEAN